MLDIYIYILHCRGPWLQGAYHKFSINTHISIIVSIIDIIINMNDSIIIRFIPLEAGGPWLQGAYPCRGLESTYP